VSRKVEVPFAAALGNRRRLTTVIKRHPNPLTSVELVRECQKQATSFKNVDVLPAIIQLDKLDLRSVGVEMRDVSTRADDRSSVSSCTCEERVNEQSDLR
jgi:hypothetical protein